ASPPIAARCSCQNSGALGCDCLQFLLTCQREPRRGESVNVARGQAGSFRLLPARPEQALLAQAHEQRIEGSRTQSSFLREVIPMPPGSGALQEGCQKGAGLTRIVGSARHGPIINICRFSVKSRVGELIDEGRGTSMAIGSRAQG